jgi:hypothetical protein
MRALALVAMMTLGAAPASTAQEEKLGLDCAWISTFDTKTMQNNSTSGSAFYLLTFTSPKAGTARKQGLGAEFAFTADEVEFVGETRYQIAGMDYTQEFRINRFTGKIEATFMIGSGGGLLHTGQCKIAQSRQF